MKRESLCRTCNKEVKLHGETFYQWACRLFEFENCDECGKGVHSHVPAVIFGNWFARCKD